ncbi:MAG: heavy metal translocating P-type ATPase [Hyphomicrobiaceae bacterium]|nr:heavy metal translocating P-type ATPase [Hyphomicrobiaceae bacterium]
MTEPAATGGARAASRARPHITSVLAVEGMHCGGCMRQVEQALAALPGVDGARANLSANRVTAVHSPVLKTTELVEALARAGFKAAELAQGSADLASTADRDLMKRLGVAGFAAANIMLLSVSAWSGAAGDMTPSVEALFHWLSALIALPAVAYAGQPFLRSAAQGLKARRLNMDVPISLGVTLAIAMSLFQTVRGTEQVYFDAAITLLFFLLMGRFLDQRMRVRTAGAAANLMGLRGTTATVISSDGTTERLCSRLLEPGMRILTVAGERFAVDGVVLDGNGMIDESLISGETAPRSVAPGALIYAGTTNLAGSLITQATATDQSTLLAEIARLMSQAEQARGHYLRLADRAARVYAPAVHILGLITFVGWLLAGQGWEAALTVAIAVLIITCPCALALAVPAVQVAATGRLFSKGVLVKAADGLERLAEIDTVIFDKTGTLTLGEPALIRASAISRSILARAAHLAAASRHPYARAILRAANAAGLKIGHDAGVRELAGFGLESRRSSAIERLGSAEWCGAETPARNASAVWYRGSDGAVVRFDFQDRLRHDAGDVLACLKAADFHLELLSGDRGTEVEAVAQQLGISHWMAGVLPAQKISRIAALKAAGRKVLMVGDGLNDAPALAAAHASLSPSTAADISQTAADAVFQGEQLAPVLEVLAVARAARRMALQNFAIAIGYNGLFVPMAMAGLVTPLLAAIAMSASSVAVTANAVRLKRMHLELER